jgi:phosphotransferase family enzyme
MIDEVARHFALGRLTAPPARVAGGLSNELWRVTTDLGDFAVKRMVVNAGQPDFVANVEAAFAVEQRAFRAGIAMPAPVAVAGRALASVAGSLFRVHRWVDGTPGAGTATQAAELLTAIHAAGAARWEPSPVLDRPGAESVLDRLAGRWGADLAELARRVRCGPDRMPVVDSHRDLDRKNTLRTADGALLALDWDAAGPIGAVHEAASVALDWSDGDPAVFREAIRAYRGEPVPAEPWIFAFWVAAQGGWLDYNATHRPGSPEVAGTLTRMRTLAANLDRLLG